MLVSGVIGVAVFYMIIMGIWAGNKQQDNSEASVILAGRQLDFVIGTFTLVATWVGAGFISGIPEVIYTKGLMWCLVPVGYSTSFLFGAIFFATPMRSAGYLTLIDPFQEAYGKQIGAILFFPILLGDVFWSAAMLSTLGTTLSVILSLNANATVVVSAVFSAIYTMLGGLYSVAYTDIVQLLYIILGLVGSIPFAWHHPAVWQNRWIKKEVWIGSVHDEALGEWIDTLLLLIFGGIPWQSYFQRILSTKSVAIAPVISFAAFICCLLMAVPCILIGVLAKLTDWTIVPGFEKHLKDSEASFILPFVLKYLTPEWVSFIGIGALSAAIMSSADSSFLSSSAIFARNIYRKILRPDASQTEVNWALKISIVVMAILASFVSLTNTSIYYLSTISSDLIYVLLFPQLILTVYWRNDVHPAGSVTSYIIGFLLRILCGEPDLGLPTLINLVYTAESGVVYKLPRRTICMLVTLCIHVTVSRLARTWENLRIRIVGRRWREEIQPAIELQ